MKSAQILSAQRDTFLYSSNNIWCNIHFFTAISFHSLPSEFYSSTLVDMSASDSSLLPIVRLENIGHKDHSALLKEYI